MEMIQFRNFCSQKLIESIGGSCDLWSLYWSVLHEIIVIFYSKMVHAHILSWSKKMKTDHLGSLMSLQWFFCSCAFPLLHILHRSDLFEIKLSSFSFTIVISNHYAFSVLHRCGELGINFLYSINKMSVTTCSTSSEIVFNSYGSLRRRNICWISPRSVGLSAYSKRKGPAHVNTCDVRRMAVSSHLAPGPLEGFFPGKTRLEGTNKKLKFIRTLLIDNYDSYTYNILQELSIVNGGKLLSILLLISCSALAKLGGWHNSLCSLLKHLMLVKLVYHILVNWVVSFIG